MRAKVAVLQDCPCHNPTSAGAPLVANAAARKATVITGRDTLVHGAGVRHVDRHAKRRVDDGLTKQDRRRGAMKFHRP